MCDLPGFASSPIINSATGSQCNVATRAIGTGGHELFVGGEFNSIGANAGAISNTANIARWDGAAWSAVGAGLSGPVHSLQTDANFVFAGGDFIDT